LISTETVAAFCQRWRVNELALFGSVLRQDFDRDSDIDILISFDQNAAWSLIDLVRMQEELETLLGRDVDLVERRAVGKSRNYIRRKHILSTAEPLYVAR
jgi:predicted nucleotidyltransferase